LGKTIKASFELEMLNQRFYFSVFHFSVLAFVQANLTLPSEYWFEIKNPEHAAA